MPSFNIYSFYRTKIMSNTTVAIETDNRSAETSFNQSRRLSERMSRISSTTTTPSDLQGRDFTANANIRIPIIGYEVMEERARFTIFKLRIENPFTNDCWLVLRRYTDFVRLNNKLKAGNPQITLTLPRKKLFGDNFGNVFLENRLRGLQIFVNNIMANETLKKSQFVRDFFCLDEPPSYSDSVEECRAIFEAQEGTITHLKLQLKSKNDTILSLQEQLAAAKRDNENLQSALKQNYKNCTKCSKENCLQENIVDNNIKFESEMNS